MSPIALHQRLKLWLRRRTGLDDTVLHIYLGLALWLGFVLLVGRGFASAWPVFGVLALECLNELFDRLRKGSWRWHETIPDLVHTMAWPVLIWIVAWSGLVN